MVKPSVHDKVNVHGHFMKPNPEQGIVHLHTDVAHLKEWPHIFDTFDTVQVRPPHNFTVRKEQEVQIHEFEDAHKTNADGTFDMVFDPKLEPWMEYVSCRRTLDGAPKKLP